MLKKQTTLWLHYFFENKSGIPITPYMERLIDGSQSPNAARVCFGDRILTKLVV